MGMDRILCKTCKSYRLALPKYDLITTNVSKICHPSIRANDLMTSIQVGFFNSQSEGRYEYDVSDVGMKGSVSSQNSLSRWFYFVCGFFNFFLHFNNLFRRSSTFSPHHFHHSIQCQHHPLNYQKTPVFKQVINRMDEQKKKHKLSVFYKFNSRSL